VRLSPLGTAATVGLLYQPQVIDDDDDDDDCGAIGGMLNDRANRSAGRKPALCPPQIPHDLSRSGGKPATNHLSYGTAKNYR
jgi:hypothetical protein